MNWYRKILAQQDINQQYSQLLSQAASIQIVGSGTNESITIPGSSKSITARELLEKVKGRLSSVLVQNHVRIIDTSPIMDQTVQGLAVSHEVGIIHVDVKKIFDNARKGIPQTNDTNITVDQDKVSLWIEKEILQCLCHESKHVFDYSSAWQQKKPFTSVQEGPAEQFEAQMGRQYFPRDKTKNN